MPAVISREKPGSYVGVPIRQMHRDPEWLERLVSDVEAWIDGERLEPAGSPFIRYWTLGGTDEPPRAVVGIPVTRPAPCHGRVVSGKLPAGRYATISHVAGPETLDASLAELDRWLWDRGLEPAWHVRDETVYWSGRFEFHLADRIEVAYLLNEGRDSAA